MTTEYVYDKSTSDEVLRYEERGTVKVLMGIFNFVVGFLLFSGLSASGYENGIFSAPVALVFLSIMTLLLAYFCVALARKRFILVLLPEQRVVIRRGTLRATISIPFHDIDRLYVNRQWTAGNTSVASAASGPTRFRYVLYLKLRDVLTKYEVMSVPAGSEHLERVAERINEILGRTAERDR